MQEKFIFNVKLLIAGIILWGIIFAYLQQHPGEQQSIIPSLQTLYDKGEVFLYGILGNDSKAIETKKSLQKMYTEIAYLIESSECHDDTALIQEVEENKAAIDNLEYAQAQNNQYNYYLKAVDLKNKIEEKCGTGLLAAQSTGDLQTGANETGSIQTGTI